MSKPKGKRFADKETAKKLKQERKLKKANAHINLKDSQKEKKSKKNKSKVNKVVINIIAFICIITIILSSIKIVIWVKDSKATNKLLSDIQNKAIVNTEQVTIGDESVTKLHYDFSELLITNPHTVGWINVSNTNINYPVVQYSDNDFYLDHSFDNSNNAAGWIFADYKCDMNNLGYNTIIYGHNRKDKTMFGSLKNALETDWLSNKNNHYLNYSTLTENHIYEIFSVFVCHDKDVGAYTRSNFANDSDFATYLNKLKNMSSYNFDTDISQTNKIITLYTCYGLNNQRLLVCAKLID